MNARTQKFVIPGKPIPLARARHNGSVIYDKQKHEKQIYRYQLLAQRKLPMFTGPLILTITFYMTIPMSWSIKKKTMMKGQLHDKKPDYSNLLKFMEDCGTGILYEDDSKIAVVIGKKIYDTEPRTEFTITEVIL